MPQHSGARLPGRQVFLRERTVNQDVVKMNPLPFQRLQQLVVRRPKGLFGESSRPQTVLIRDHDQFKIQIFPDEIEIAENLRIKGQFLQAVELIINGRLDDQRPVAIYKQSAFH